MKGFVRVSSAIPICHPGDVAENFSEISKLMEVSAKEASSIVVFPELCITGSTCKDLFFTKSLLDSAADALAKLAKRSADFPATTFIVGLPVMFSGKIYDTAAVLCGGRICGIVPKRISGSPTGWTESRWFCDWDGGVQTFGEAFGDVSFGEDLLFSDSKGRFTFGIEVGEIAFVPKPKTADLALAGATIILNPSATSGELYLTFQRAISRSTLSARTISAIVNANSGFGESSSDAAYCGAAIAVENGNIVYEKSQVDEGFVIVSSEIDIDFLAWERSRNFAFRAASRNAAECGHTVILDLAEATDASLIRKIDPHPFVQGTESEINENCNEAFGLQVKALMTRLRALKCKDVVIGLSGGLDSALALLVCHAAFQKAGLSCKGIHVYTMPGFGTTKRTKGNAELLCEGLGLSIETIDITETTRSHFSDIGQSESKRDAAYENAQARMRTMILMDKANQLNGIVIGTGDLSELALGWCTFNGDHMSMYGVNAGVPKTFIREEVRWYAQTMADSDSKAGKALLDILATPVSPELLPAKADGTIAQETEDKVGPYELHDFFLYHMIRRGATKERIFALAKIAFKDAYDEATILKWLDVFFRRFATQQFKRNCSPDAPKIGSVSLSPTTGWQMPSDI